MKRKQANGFLLAGLIMVNSCGPRVTPEASERELVGKWCLAELRTQKGNRGPATGILEGETEFRADGSFSAWILRAGEAQEEDRTAISFSGSWSLSNTFLIFHPLSNAPPLVSKAWFDGRLLALEPQGQPKLTYYYSRMDSVKGSVKNGG